MISRLVEKGIGDTGQGTRDKGLERGTSPINLYSPSLPAPPPRFNDVIFRVQITKNSV